MQFIRDELGNSESLSEYDITPHYHRYLRNDTRKVERIGKKYQWIALYNILARVSDRYLVKNWGMNLIHSRDRGSLMFVILIRRSTYIF